MFLWGELQTVVQSAPRSYARRGFPVNRASVVRALEAAFFLSEGLVKNWTSKIGWWNSASARAQTRPGQRAVLGLELALDRGEDGERSLEHGRVVRGHHARAQQRAPGGTAGWSAVLTNTPRS